MKRLRQWRTLGAITLGATSAILGLQWAGGLQSVEWTVLDRWFRLRPAEAQTVPIVVVAINEADISHLGQWPLSDAQLAALINKLKQSRPAMIGLNLYRNLPVEPGNAELQQVFATTPNLIGVQKAVGNSIGAAVPAPPGLRDRGQVAVNDLILDSDGTVRRNLISVNTNGETILALGTQLAVNYLSTQKILPQEGGADRTEIRLGKGIFRPMSSTSGGYIRTDTGGYQVLSNFLRISRGIPSVSLGDVMAGRVSTERLQGKIVLIGSNAESLWGDRFHTPFTTDGGVTWTNVELQANLAAQIITSAQTGRPVLQGVPEAWQWVWVLFWSGLGTFLGWSQRSLGGLGWLVGSISSLLAIGYGLFLLGWWVVVISPLLALLSAGLLSRSYWAWQTLQEANQLLEFKVQQRTQELLDKNAALEHARLEADAANQAKTLFLTSMSHELRTPLTAILGFSELMGCDPETLPSQKESLSIISRSGEHLLALINEILEMSKIEAGKITLNPEDFDLYALLNNVKAMLQQRAIAKGLKLRFDRPPTLPQFVHTDEKRLRQVLINLLGNAIKFTDRGQVELRVFATATADSTLSTLHIAVEDTGVGISAQEINTLFQPFVQTEAGRKARQGTGLGLSISRRIVQLLGGDISVTSQVGVGSCFQLWLPIQLRPAPPEAATKAATASDPPLAIALAPGQPRPQILVVDDVLENCQLLQQLLQSLGFEVQTVSTGAAAIEHWQSWRPDLILMDIKMAGMDGCETTRQIRQQEKHLVLSPTSNEGGVSPASTVIVALTADAFGREHEEMLAAGCDDFLYKPFLAHDLLEKITQWLGTTYLYTEAESETKNEIVQESSLPLPPLSVSSADLAKMPSVWIAQLHQAIIEADDQQVLKLTETLPAEQENLQAAIAALVYDFRFDVLTELMESVIRINELEQP
jgi:adenylate cyclase